MNMALSPEELRDAPKVWISNASGMRMRQVDPAWRKARDERLVRMDRLNKELEVRRLAEEERNRVLRERQKLDRQRDRMRRKRKAETERLIAIDTARAIEIMHETAAFHDVSFEDLTGKSTAMTATIPRYHAIFDIVSRCPALSKSAIGRIFGHQHHKIVLRAIEEWPKRAKLFGLTLKIVPLEEKQ